MKKMIFLLTLSIFLVGIQTNVELNAQANSDPEENFEHLWKTFDRNYAIFGAKRVDWDALYKIYRPQVTPRTTGDELFTVMSNMLGHLNDNHVRLITPQKRFTSGILRDLKMEDFSLDLIKNKYLKEKFKTGVRNIFTYGWLSDTIGYFHFRGFGFPEQSREAIDEIIEEFKDARGIVVDVRQNGGGDDRVGKLIADRFADRKRLYMITRIRSGQNHGDFTPPRYWYVEPDGPHQFNKTVILLTHRYSVSAADNFTLAMRVIPHVTVVGDFTSGCFADVYRDQLPNGWGFSVSYKLFTDQNGFCWEGIGIPPDLRQTNSKTDIENKTDRVLELALKLIDSGSLKPQKESDSLTNIRQSLAERLEQAIEKEGLESAVTDFQQAKSGNPETYYIDREELDMLANRLTQAGKLKEAIEVFKINVTEHPQHWMVYRNLGRAYARQGNKKLAQENYQQALKRNPGAFPWEREARYTMALEQSLMENGTAGMVRQCRSFWKSQRTDMKEAMLNRFGYELLRRKKVKAAIEIFKLNVDFYPEAWNTYDSLGEAYMTAGNKKLAIKNYKKSLELNPKNDNAREILKKLEKK
jgi:carboxyl-terminal processing protease